MTILIWAHLALGCTILFQSMNAVAVRVLVGSLDPASLNVLRFGLASAFFLLMALGTTRELLRSPRTWPAIVAMALSGVVANNLLYTWGLRHAPAADGALFWSVASLVGTFLLVALCLKERLTRTQVAGSCVALTGVAMIVGFAWQGHDLARVLSEVLLIGSGLAWAVYTIIGRALSARYSPRFLAAWSTVVGTLLMVPFQELDHVGRAAAALSIGDALVLTYLGVGGTAVTFWCWQFGVKYVGAVPAVVYGLSIPGVTLLLDIVLLHEGATIVQVAGTIVATVGVGWAQAAELTSLRSPRVPSTTAVQGGAA